MTRESGSRLRTHGRSTWQQELKWAIRDPQQLCQELRLAPSIAEAAVRGGRSFSLFVPRPFLARIRVGDPDDPLLRQVLPTAEELPPRDGFLRDPVQDLHHQLRPGVIHKYRGRSLLITTGACAAHCRYCFRRFFPYGGGPRSPADWQPALDEMARDADLEEVILSGGDPLTLADSHVAELTERLNRIPQLQRLRLHTRLPILIPQRVTRSLIRALLRSRRAIVIVIHANHAQELDAPVAESLRRFVRAGFLVLNQSVLLRGINDQVEILAELSRRLLSIGVLPYYLHQLDRVEGAAHFEVPVHVGVELIRSLRQQLPGYAVPTYVRDDPGEPSKTVLC